MLVKLWYSADTYKSWALIFALSLDFTLWELTDVCDSKPAGTDEKCSFVQSGIFLPRELVALQSAVTVAWLITLYKAFCSCCLHLALHGWNTLLSSSRLPSSLTRPAGYHPFFFLPLHKVLTADSLSPAVQYPRYQRKYLCTLFCCVWKHTAAVT